MTVVEAELRERRTQVWEDARRLIEQAADRRLTRDEDVAFARFNGQLDVLDQRIASIMRARERATARSRTCSYCHHATERGRPNCRTCGAPLEEVA